MDRKVMYRKRKNTVIKKAEELSKLCEISVCLIIYPEDDQKTGRPIRPETWPEDPIQFNGILERYKASKDIHVPSLKRDFRSSDFAYEPAAKKMKKQVDDANNKIQIWGEEDKYPTWDDRIEELSQDELIKLTASLDSKIQDSSRKIDSMERCFSAKHNQSTSKGITNNAKQLMPQNVPRPMFPSAWISSSG